MLKNKNMCNIYITSASISSLFEHVYMMLITKLNEKNLLKIRRLFIDFAGVIKCVHPRVIRNFHLRNSLICKNIVIFSGIN